MSKLALAKRVVVKIGSALVAHEGKPNADWMRALGEDVQDLMAGQAQVLLVSSGSVALGRARLGLAPRRKLDLPQKQAAAAAGQSALMRAWEDAFAPTGLAVAQALLTGADTEDRRRFLNARATLETLLDLGAVPVVNENDTVATEEIRVGDNDRLAARVAAMINADVLVLLSDVDGLYTADPRSDPQARHIAHVPRLDASIEAMAGGANQAAGVGTGGMATKIKAAQIAGAAGCATIIGLGTPLGPLARIAANERHTLIEAESTPRAAYKAWLVGTLAPKGALVLDAGAQSAVLAGKSLLPAGVCGVEGQFAKGDCVDLRNVSGQVLGRGLVRYDAEDAGRICGLRSTQIESVLGYDGGASLVHADDLALV